MILIVRDIEAVQHLQGSSLITLDMHFCVVSMPSTFHGSPLDDFSRYQGRSESSRQSVLGRQYDPSREETLSAYDSICSTGFHEIFEGYRFVEI